MSGGKGHGHGPSQSTDAWIWYKDSGLIFVTTLVIGLLVLAFWGYYHRDAVQGTGSGDTADERVVADDTTIDNTNAQLDAAGEDLK